MNAVLIISHGSHSPKTKKEVEALCEELKARRIAQIIRFAFLEIESPNIPDGIAACVKDGAQKIFVLLNFLNSGRHVDGDIPAILEDCRRQFPQVAIKISKPIGQHPKIPDLLTDYLHGLQK